MDRVRYTIEIPGGTVGWKLLREQKEQLIRMSFRTNTRSADCVALEGVINFLDYLQDEAVNAGYLEDDIFGKDTE